MCMIRQGSLYLFFLPSRFVSFSLLVLSSVPLVFFFSFLLSVHFSGAFLHDCRSSARRAGGRKGGLAGPILDSPHPPSGHMTEKATSRSPASSGSRAGRCES